LRRRRLEPLICQSRGATSALEAYQKIGIVSVSYSIDSKKIGVSVSAENGVLGLTLVTRNSQLNLALRTYDKKWENKTNNAKTHKANKSINNM